MTLDHHHATGLPAPAARAARAAPACAGHDPELFWPATVADAERAASVCRGCPLVVGCLAGAQQRREWGVWGGVLLARGRPSTELPGNVRPPNRVVPRSA